MNGLIMQCHEPIGTKLVVYHNSNGGWNYVDCKFDHLLPRLSYCKDMEQFVNLMAQELFKFVGFDDEKGMYVFEKRPYTEIYNTKLKDVRVGNIALFYNYPSSKSFMRVEAGEGYMMTHQPKPTISDLHPIDDDGFHVPVVCLQTGKLTWMSKEKPCLLLGRPDF